jgi:hypothetical protein
MDFPDLPVELRTEIRRISSMELFYEQLTEFLNKHDPSRPGEFFITGRVLFSSIMLGMARPKGFRGFEAGTLKTGRSGYEFI